MAVEAAKQGVTVGEDTVPGLMVADVLVGKPEAPEGLKKQIEKGPENRTARTSSAVCSQTLYRGTHYYCYIIWWVSRRDTYVVLYCRKIPNRSGLGAFVSKTCVM